MKTTNRQDTYLDTLEKGKTKVEKELNKQITYTDKQMELFPEAKDFNQGEFVIHLISNEFLPSTVRDGIMLEETDRKAFYMVSTDKKCNFSISKSLYQFAVYLTQSDNDEMAKTQTNKNVNTDDVAKLDNGVIEFDKLLANEAEAFSNPQLEKLIKTIFLSEHGYYDPFAKSLLVLINHIDNKMYKGELIKRLCSGNTASQKTFECATGIKLPKSHVDIKKFLQYVTKSDFKTPIEYVPLKSFGASGEQVFQIKSKGNFIDVTGYPYGTYGLNLFIYYRGEKVYICDTRTGSQLAEGISEEDVKLILQEKIDSKGIKSLLDVLAKQPVSPCYDENKSGVENDEDKDDSDEDEDDSDEDEDDEE